MNKDIPLETGLAIRKPPLIKPARLINRGCACGINKQSLNQYQVQFQIFPSLRSFTFSGQDQNYLYPMQRCDMIPVSINKSYDLPLKKRIMFLRLPRIITIRRGTSIFRTIRPATNTILTVRDNSGHLNKNHQEEIALARGLQDQNRLLPLRRHDWESDLN